MENSNLKDQLLENVSDESSIDGFIFLAQDGLCNRDEILDKLELANNKVNEYTEQKDELKKSDNPDMTRLAELQDNLTKWEGYLSKLEEVLSDYKNFNKKLVFSNIRSLISKNPDVKIGQIEKEAGIRLGYMSRLEKEGNTSEPSVEFIVTAAKLLKVSLDTLVNVDVTALTPTEEYLTKFFDKLKKDTIADKLNWDKETPDELNRMNPDLNGNVEHPLFSYEEFYEKGETDYPDLVNRVIFMSNSFGTNTYIHGDCFNLRLKNATYIYLMNLSKTVCNVKDPNRYAKEIWTWAPQTQPKFLISNNDKSPLSSMVDILFDVVSERANHPKIESSYKDSFDAFMNDDLTDDEDFNLPF